MFRSATLVGRNQKFIAVILLNTALKVVEIHATCISLIPEHHSRPLIVAHGVGSAIGEQVDVNVLGFQEKGVVTCFAECLFALLSRGRFDELDHLDFERFCPGTFFSFACHVLFFALIQTAPFPADGYRAEPFSRAAD